MTVDIIFVYLGVILILFVGCFIRYGIDNVLPKEKRFFEDDFTLEMSLMLISVWPISIIGFLIYYTFKFLIKLGECIGRQILKQDFKETIAKKARL